MKAEHRDQIEDFVIALFLFALAMLLLAVWALPDLILWLEAK